MKTLPYHTYWPQSLVCGASPDPAADQPNFRRKPSGLLVPAIFWFGMAAASSPAHALLVDLNTNGLIGTGALLDFSLLDGDNSADNQASISAVSTDGTLLATVCSVSCGANAGGFTISDANGFGEFQQYLTLGHDVNFQLNVSNAFVGGAPDRLVLSLLDPNTSFTLTTTNLNLNDATSVQDALLTIDYTGGANNLIRVATTSDPFIGVSVVPSPASWGLILPWGLWLIRRGRHSNNFGFNRPFAYNTKS